MRDALTGLLEAVVSPLSGNLPSTDDGYGWAYLLGVIAIFGIGLWFLSR